MNGTTARFLWKFAADPRRIGALQPATDRLAQRVAQAAQVARQQSAATALPLVELGAGTGALTRALAALQPVVVERDGAWANQLRQAFPQLEVRTECALQTLARLDTPVGLVSSIPLRNNPQAQALRAALGRAHAQGLIRYCVLYTYGLADPLDGVGFAERRRVALVLGNLPPARVWAYR